MSENTGQDQQTWNPARRLHMYPVLGDTLDEIELAALDEAREFFGRDLRLRIMPGWKAFPAEGNMLQEVKQSGKRYYAGLDVEVIEP